MPKFPDVANVMVDHVNKVTYRILAHRTLTHEEHLAEIQYFRSTREGRDWLKPGATITILSRLGSKPKKGA